MSFTYFYTQVFSCGTTLWPWIAGLMANATLLLAGIALLGPVVGRRNPSLRHAIATLGLGGLIFLPPLSLAVSRGAGFSLSLQDPFATLMAMGPISSSLFGETIDAGPALLAIWMAGAALILTRLGLDLIILEWHARRGASAPSSWDRMARRLARRLNLRRDVRVLRTGAIDIPCTWGFLRPVILLPACAIVWNEERLKSVLLHELGHVRRNDGALRFLARIACALFWIHPVAWWIERTSRDDAERACDRTVVEAGIAPGRYARHILQIVRDAQRPERAIAPSMAAGSQLGQRIAALLDPQPTCSRSGRISIAAVTLAIVGMTTFLGVESAPAVAARSLPFGDVECPGVAGETQLSIDQILKAIATEDQKLLTAGDQP